MDKLSQQHIYGMQIHNYSKNTTAYCYCSTCYLQCAAADIKSENYAGCSENTPLSCTRTAQRSKLTFIVSIVNITILYLGHVLPK